MSDGSAEILHRVEGRAGILSLNRPRQIHALTHGMVRAMTDRLLAWASDDGIDIVLLDHAVANEADARLSRGFCAGGDIALVRQSVLDDGGIEGRAFFRDEYRLNTLMHDYAKPIVAFMDGVTMGGGVGIALPARWRVATPNTLFAMPETAIGLFPDVGGGWDLPRLPGRLGAYLALTGARIDGADCLAAGVATHYLDAGGLAMVKTRIAAAPGDAERILATASVAAPIPTLLAHRDAIDRLFASDRLEDIFAALADDPDPWAARTLTILTAKSPQACKVTLRQLALGARCASFAENMAMEYRLAARVILLPDFVEGVRAVLVDKDQSPRWSPPVAGQVDDGVIEALFAPLPPEEEWTPLSC